MAESLIGKPIPRIDGYIKVTGKAQYITDITRPGMLFAKILFSDRPHARILRIDSSLAQNLPGIKAIITGDDAPNILYGLYIFDRYIFAKGKVRHIGEPVAAVAATSQKIADQAIKLIKVDYEDLPAIFTIEDALKPDAPIIHQDIEKYSGIHPFIKYGNVCMDARINMGNIEKGFAESDFIFEHTYKTNPMHQASLENHACLAEYDVSGKLTIWTGTQQLTICHVETAVSLGIPMNKIRVIPAWLGGGFGGKLKTLHEQIVVLLTKATGSPVKLVLTREEEFTATHPRAGFIIRVKTGVKKDGTLVAREADVLSDVGAYTDHALGMINHAITYVSGPYKIPHLQARGRGVYTNNPDWGCMRGYGGLEIAWATETQLDIIAKQIGIDPAEIRLKNLCADGEKFITTQELRAVNIRETMEQALTESGYYEKKDKLKPNHGIGIANSILNTGFLASSAFVRLNPDGTLSILTSITDLGTGNHTALCQIAAETLGVPFDNVSIAAQDSESSPYDTGSISSRTIFDAGNAIRMATLEVVRQVQEIAAISYECDPNDIELENGFVFDKNHPQTQRKISEIAFEAIFLRNGPLMGRGATLANPPFDHHVGIGYGERPAGSYTFATHVVELEVDPVTGKINIQNYTASHDVGKIINLAGIEGQVEGGVVQGIGYGLYEEIQVKDGKILNPSFADYRLPTALDVPSKIKCCFIEKPEPRGPFGAKGVSEPPMIPPPPAIANAILDATGAQVTETPITPERLYLALKQRKK